ncbi:MAG: arylsulfatase [Candidatus Hydrogenedentota bacterium]
MQTTRRSFLCQTALAASSLTLGNCATARRPVKRNAKPNIVIFFTDDHGYADLSCAGSPDIRTPHIDAIAADGARLTSWYSNSPVCSASRAALLTGRYPGNTGVRGVLPGHREAAGLLPEIPTIASALKPLGYRTALAGKWHLGVLEQCRPHNHGFDEWFGFMAGCIDFYSHIFYWHMAGANGKAPVHDLWKNNEEIWENGRYFTDLITEHAVDFVNRAASSGDPFFLYVPYNAPHYPMHAPPEYMNRFGHLPWERQVMAAMLSCVDDSIGAVVNELKRQGVYDNTLIVFTSDNGPSREVRNWLDGNEEPYYGGSQGDQKGHKFSLYEGGIRVPGVVSWPGHIPAGQVLDAPVASMDVFPTLLRAAGGDPGAYTIDGLDVMPVLTRQALSPHGDLFWEHQGQTAVRRGKWKLVLHGTLVEGAPPEDDVHLSNLDEDPGEKVNLVNREPDIAAELRSAAESWRARIDQRWETEWKPKLEAAS